MTPHTLLEELFRLGVQLSTDGMNLTINAPKGAITPDLREQLVLHKQELITQIVLASSSQDEDEELYAFVQAISYVIGGQDLVRIHGLTLEQYRRSIRPPYQPVTLPALPRRACPHQVMVTKREKDGTNIVAEKCQGQPLQHGWCEEHALSDILLFQGAILDYPSVDLGCREIEEGVAQWEAYAQCATRDHLASDIASICDIFRISGGE